MDQSEQSEQKDGIQLNITWQAPSNKQSEISHSPLCSYLTQISFY